MSIPIIWLSFYRSSFYDLAKKVICRRNQSASAFSTPIKFNRKQNALNDMDQRFMTRTRLRKGGPPTHTPSLQRPVYGGSQEVQSIYGTPLLTLGRRDPPAGLDMSTFRSVNGRGGNRYPGSDLYFGTNGGPSTPLVMHKTSPNGSIPPNGRVQMFRTRVVYNETRDDVLHSKSQEASVWGRNASSGQKSKLCQKKGLKRIKSCARNTAQGFCAIDMSLQLVCHRRLWYYFLFDDQYSYEPNDNLQYYSTT